MQRAQRIGEKAAVPAMLVLLSFGSVCAAGDQDARARAQPAGATNNILQDQSEGGEDILRGPKVSDEAERTLIRRDGMGRFVPIEQRPEEAALVVAEIDATRRELAKDVVAERRTALGMHLVENVELVRDATDAVRAGDEDRVNTLAHELYDSFDPDHGRDPLLKPLSNVLSPAESAEVKRLVDEYWNAWIAWELRSQMNPPEEARDRVQQRLSFRLFQQEIRRAYEWSLGPYRRKLERIYEIVEPTDEQRVVIRDAVIDHIREAKLHSTPEQRRELAQRIYDALDDEQRMKLFELIVIDLR